MVPTVVLGVLVVALVVKICLGPRRWHRMVGAHTRPGSQAPDTEGEVIIRTRDLAALVVLGVVLGVVLHDWAGEWRTDERLYDATYAAVRILPPENLETAQVETLVEQLTGEEVLMVISSDEGSEASLEDVYWAPDDESVPEEELDLPAPAACLAIDRDAMGGIDVTEGPCADRTE